jgi:long-chain acyl-CoA synthetase
MLPNVPLFPVFYYGVLRAGGAVVPMNPLLKSREVTHYVGDSGARLVLAWETAADEARAGAEAAGASAVIIGGAMLAEVGEWPLSPEVARRADEDTAVILYTSGTTGTPKGAELTHVNMRRNASVTATTLLGLGPDDVVMGCLPLFHSFGQTCGLNAAVLSGASVTLIPRFSGKAALQVIERDQVTVFEGVPTMYVAMLHEGAGAAGTATLRLCVSGGAALPVEVLHGFEEAFGTVILEGYGLSETSPVATFNRRGRRKPGSIGLPVEGVELRLVSEEGGEVAAGEVGEIAIRGHNVMKGYRGRPEATAAAISDGWFRTGDLARADEDGFYYIVDRKKDMIIRGGYNVYPREVEEVLYEHPAVLEAAVIGTPHSSLGEEVAAAVVLRPGGQATPEELRDWVKQRVAAYKYPRHVWLADALPKGPTGKILKREITVPAQQEAGRP